ncbi:imidazoleglycerol-phosphate dehydratase HisB [Candidatus Methylacidiphilum infernorum]|uniref:imidazoleglycerol-phosphate dehydratase HisB n=1 Tax=Candidatus Methylacidiphilum infernorum TaxID=511746 RepID=UPI000314FF8F|nr:imidazoleglycerol-phosphate dehydratase HisB [Candidatus Methylacidiphilum infernorum]
MREINTPRKASVQRNTKETAISLEMTLDGQGKSDIKTGIGFLDHMLELFSFHGSFDLTLKCEGDLHVDFHHTVEDCGIVLGEAFNRSLGDKKGINRYGFYLLPMDETLVHCAVDISGRPFLCFRVPEKLPLFLLSAGSFPAQLLEEFLRAFVVHGQLCLHMHIVEGKEVHHLIEGSFKALARTLKMAVGYDTRSLDRIPTTKGLIGS